MVRKTVFYTFQTHDPLISTWLAFCFTLLITRIKIKSFIKEALDATINKNLMTDLIGLSYFTDLHWKCGSPCMVSAQLDRLISCKLVSLTKTLKTSSRNEEITVIMSLTEFSRVGQPNDSCH